MFSYPCGRINSAQAAYVILLAASLRREQPFILGRGEEPRNAAIE
jgi:hypothetical protein